ncbi:MAG: hypothetical protein KJO38_08800, partial [Gammaproteobacteria bacterium]|nr:hypothetical protein [Gammaproteobacteria bacterium]
MRASVCRLLVRGFPALLCLASGGAAAGVFDDIGYTALLESGAAPPTGAAIRIDQVEASRTQPPVAPEYFPNPLDSELAGKTLIDQSSIPGST